MSCLDCPDFTPEGIQKYGCPFRMPGDCTYYTGPSIPQLQIVTGDSLNDVVAKLVAGFFGTTTTTTTTSSTTTTTTTTALNDIYVGSKNSSVAPTLSEVQAGLLSHQLASNNVTANWTSFTTDAYMFVAIPAAYAKTKWEDTSNPLNAGNIGTGDDLFGAATQLTINGVAYNVYTTNYPTSFATPILIKAS